jgi:hypothetical protein
VKPPSDRDVSIIARLFLAVLLVGAVGYLLARAW